MKSALLLTLVCGLVACCSAQTMTVVSVNVPGGANPQTFCSVTGGGDSGALASFSGTEFNVSAGVSLDSTDSPLTSFVTVAGSIYWVIQYNGPSAPPSQAPVVLQFTSSLEMNSTSGVGNQNYIEEVGDEIYPSEDCVAGASFLGRKKVVQTEITTVATWTLISPGVWQGKTGYYSPNLALTGEVVGPTPPVQLNSVGCQYANNVSVYSVNGILVQNG